MSAGRWCENVFILDNAVVGAVVATASGEWDAAGCYRDWMDVDLKTWKSKSEAKRAVEKWVRRAGGTDEN